MDDPLIKSNSEVESVDIKDVLDELEANMLASDIQIEFPLTHRFTPELYIREIFMPAGSFIISKIHRTEHPYIVSKGKVSVITESDGEVLIQAPHTGITKPGTRRVLFCHEDTIWITVHALEKEGETLEEIERRIIEPNINKHLKNNHNDLGSSRSGISSSNGSDC